MVLKPLFMLPVLSVVLLLTRSWAPFWTVMLSNLSPETTPRP